MHKFAKLSVGAAVVLGLAAVTADIDRPASAATADRAVSRTIAIDGARFDPTSLTVPVGTTIKWINKDPYPHNVTSKVGGFQSGNLNPNREWRLRPARRGTFEYVCTLHPGMKAVLRVQ